MPECREHLVSNQYRFSLIGEIVWKLSFKFIGFFVTEDERKGCADAPRVLTFNSIYRVQECCLKHIMPTAMLDCSGGDINMKQKQNTKPRRIEIYTTVLSVCEFTHLRHVISMKDIHQLKI